MTPAELTKWIRALPDRATAELMKAETENIADALQTAQKYSKGPFKTAQIRALYSPKGPYSVESPHPPADASIINEQGGDFLKDWQTEGPALNSASDSIDSKAKNAAPYADLLAGGTKRMIARKLPAAVEAEIMPRVKRRRQAALRRASKP